MYFAIVAIQRFEVLDGVGLDARTAGVSKNRVKVDEDLSPKEPVDLVLAGGISAHQPLERCRFIGSEVVDVHSRPAAKALSQEVDQQFERGLLLLRIERPVGSICLSTILVPEGVAEQVFETAHTDEWISFQVQEHVARTGFRKP